jgi:oryzin
VTDAFSTLVTQSNADWSLASLSSPEAFMDESPRNYNYDDTAGTGMFAYLVDSGVFIGHEDLGGRAIDGFTVDETGSFFDDLGHGTHTAGTIASSTYGIAKNATLVNVKIAYSSVSIFASSQNKC